MSPSTIIDHRNRPQSSPSIINETAYNHRNHLTYSHHFPAAIAYLYYHLYHHLITIISYHHHHHLHHPLLSPPPSPSPAPIPTRFPAERAKASTFTRGSLLCAGITQPIPWHLPHSLWNFVSCGRLSSQLSTSWSLLTGVRRWSLKPGLRQTESTPPRSGFRALL